MIQIILLLVGLVGIGGPDSWASTTTGSTPRDIELTSGSIDSGNGAVGLSVTNPLYTDPPLIVAQRQSSRPPGESRSGRISSRPAGNLPESKRDSGRTIDPVESPTQLETESTSHQRPEESMATPKREGDPVEGGRKSQPATKRRGGVVK